MSTKLKVVTMYLPQYHRIPENDVWWGDGYTDWTAVKAAEKYFKEQNQPRVPLENNYYDLSQVETLKWQAELMKRYGIDGQCFYHYYFKDGRKILEKPAELLLKNKDIDMPFCFCWANDSWARSWSKISNTNQWAEKFETKKGSQILLEQGYGDKQDWKKHFDYLVEFFIDDRYIKVNNCPLFIIYRPESIACLGEMIDVFNDSIREYGYPGICFLGANLTKALPKLDAAIYVHASAYFNPDVSGMYLEEKRINNIRTYDYDDVWNNILRTKPVENMKTYYGGIVDQDDTPRRGKLGFCLTGVTPAKFQNYLYKLALKNLSSDCEYLFIDAWNEWGEGNYLEPDEEHKYEYLEAVQAVKKQLPDNICEIEDQWEKTKNDSGTPELAPIIKQLKKYKKYYNILNQWLQIKENNISVENYFKKKNWKHVAIYGFMALGNHLLWELQNTDVKVEMIIDRRSELTCPGVKVISPKDSIEGIDVVVVTPVYEYEEIKNELQKNTNVQIVSIEDVINESYSTFV